MGVFQNGYGLFTRHVRKTIEVFIQAKAAFQIVEQAFHWHSRTMEAGRAAQSFGINPDGDIRREMICGLYFHLVFA